MGFGDTGDRTLGSLVNSGSSGGGSELIYAAVKRDSAVMIARVAEMGERRVLSSGTRNARGQAGELL